MSTSDRGLLELAAKAAGMGELVFMSEPERYEVVWLPAGSDCNQWKPWNPLEDDGDALRLAVRLRLEIYFFDGFFEVVAEHNTGSYEPGREQYSDDMNAATRRAIVRAAAAIGRSMP